MNDPITAMYNAVAAADKVQLEDDLRTLMKVLVEVHYGNDSRVTDATSVLERYGISLDIDTYYDIQRHDFPEDYDG